jgi:hypothetical protein
MMPNNAKTNLFNTYNQTPNNQSILTVDLVIRLRIDSALIPY